MKKKIVLIVASIFVVVALVAGVTYAFYSANVNRINESQTVVKTNKLTLTYTGGQEINVSGIVPGDSFTKTFTVENTSNIAVDYNIYMENITNEFNEDLVYELADETGKIISERKTPNSVTGKTYINTNITIEAGKIKSYILKITFKNSDTDQNNLQGKIFSATLGVDTKKINSIVVSSDEISISNFTSGNSKNVSFEVSNVTNQDKIYNLKFGSIENEYGNNLTYNLSKNGLTILENQNINDDYFIKSQLLKADENDTYEITIMNNERQANSDNIKLLANNNFYLKIMADLKYLEPVSNNNIYEIRGINDINWFKEKIKTNNSVNVKLINDINLNGSNSNQWVPIENYSGIFDGNNKKISGIYINKPDSSAQAFFTSIDNKSVIKNLTIDGEITASKTSAGLVQKLYGTIENCTNNISVKTSGDDAAGLVWYAGTNSIIRNSINNAVIKSEANTASGIVANSNNSDNVLIENCTNNGEIIANTFASGILAYNINISNLTMKNNVNNAKITANNQYSSGILAYINNANSVTVSQNINNGIIVAKNSGASGIISGIFASKNINVNKNINKKTISISNSNNYGCGGIIANISTLTETLNVYENKNVGEISGYGHIAGIVANMWNNPGDSLVKIYNNYNMGSITASGMDAGGIVANFDNDAGMALSLYNNYNVGNVSEVNNQYVGAILGLQGNTIKSVNINNNYYLNSSTQYAVTPTKNSVGSTSNENMKKISATLGSAFKNDSNNVNNGYPIFTWE